MAACRRGKTANDADFEKIRSFVLPFEMVRLLPAPMRFTLRTLFLGLRTLPTSSSRDPLPSKAMRELSLS